MRHFPGRVPRLATQFRTPAWLSVAGLPSRDRILIGSCLIAITALAWGYLFYLDRQMSPAMEPGAMMAGMDMSMAMSWTAADVLVAFGMWVVMMIGMMVPSAAPVMLVFAGAHARRGRQWLPLIVLFFGLSYVAVWVGFSACAALTQWALHRAALLSPMTAISSAQAGAGILIAVGVYQLTPFKRACLMHCQSPLGFLVTHWRDGRLGALQMGMRHGAYCLGCCWALMGILFVVGVMNLLWVTGLTLFVLLEKLGPAGPMLARVAGVAMMIVGTLLLASAQ